MLVLCSVSNFDYELLPETLLNSDHKLSEMKHEHTKRFLGLGRHFTAVSTVALLVNVVGVTSLLPWLKFHYCVPFTVFVI